MKIDPNLTGLRSANPFPHPVAVDEAGLFARITALPTPTDREIYVERVFDAPRDRVYAAFTDPKLIPEWWGSATAVDHMDVRTGGTWRFVARNPEGSELAFGGERRRLTTTMVFDTTEEHDNLLAYGGERGINEGYSRLDDLLAKHA
jgi:hypothetical protein